MPYWTLTALHSSHCTALFTLCLHCTALFTLYCTVYTICTVMYFKQFTALFALYCTVYIVLYCIHCTVLFILFCIVCTICTALHCKLYGALFTVLHWILYTVHCTALFSLYCTEYCTVYTIRRAFHCNALNTVHCTLYGTKHIEGTLDTVLIIWTDRSIMPFLHCTSLCSLYGAVFTLHSIVYIVLHWPLYTARLTLYCTVHSVH